MKKLLFFAAALALLSACAAPRAAIKPGFDLSSIRTIRIGDFSSAVSYTNAGSVVANEFIRQLLGAGYRVVTGADTTPADAVLEGNVTEYLPNHRYLVQKVKSEGGTTVVVQPPVEISGSSLYNLGSVSGLGTDSQIIVSNATVGVSAYLKDARTGEVLWSNAYTYEGLDLNTALDGSVRYLIGSLRTQ